MYIAMKVLLNNSFDVNPFFIRSFSCEPNQYVLDLSLVAKFTELSQIKIKNIFLKNDRV